MLQVAGLKADTSRTSCRLPVEETRSRNQETGKTVASCLFPVVPLEADSPLTNKRGTRKWRGTRFKDKKTRHWEVGERGTSILKRGLDHGMIYSYRRR